MKKVFVSGDFNIYSYQDEVYNLDNGLFGTIKDKRFKEFWFNDKDKFFKITPSKDCQNHCVANGRNRMILDYLNIEHLGFV